MYTEIIKIIEGGIKREPAKVIQFAQKLADVFENDGNTRLAKGIRKVIDNGALNTLAMEQLTTTAPVDSDTRMSIVDIFNPVANDLSIILPEITERKVMDFIKIIENKDKIKSLGLPIHSSLLLYGIPGVGKTTIAQYISTQTKLPLVTARLHALISSLLGNTAKNIRNISEYADSKPCILFLDEFDAIAKARDDEHEMGELKRVINSRLQNIDVFSQNNILIAETNHPELLDKAIWRRFNTIIEVSPFGSDGVRKLVELYSENYKHDFSSDKKMEKIIHLLSRKTPADIKTIVTNAITQAVIQEKEEINAEDLLIEIFQFEKHGNFTADELIKYLNDNGVPKLQIADILNISDRKSVV